MATKVTIAYIDESNERTSCSFEGVDLTSANYDAQLVLINAVKDAMDDLALGTFNKMTISSITDGASTLPGSPYAQRENKLRLTYSDDVDGRKFNTNLPTINLADDGAVSGTDVWDMTETNPAALKAAFEAYAKAPGTGEDVTVDEMRFVSHNV